MHLKRKIEAYLNSWINTKKGLLIKGQRQVGKTYIVEHCLKPYFDNVVQINLLLDKNLCSILSTCKNSESFLDRLHLYFNFDDKKEKVLLFIDEIQESYRYQNNIPNNDYIDLLTISKSIITSTKIRVVFSGSLLGIEIFDVLNKVDSLPMGYVDIVEMFPIDFEEFLWANNINERIIGNLVDCFNNKIPIDNAIHTRMMELFNQYLLIGGMPDAVKSFIENRNLQEVNNIHKQINNYISADISKYASINDKLKIKEIYKILPSELNSQTKRFNLKDIKDFKKSLNLNLSFSWLTNAGIAIPVFNTNDLAIPLKIDSHRNLLKLFHADVGLLTYLYFDITVKQKLLIGDLNVNKGSIVENFVAQQLHAHGFEELYYYNNKRNGELDFVVVHNSNILPIEIKSGKDYKRHSALNNVLSNSNRQLPQAFVFCNSNIKKVGQITYFPIYLVSFLTKD
ncbi:MAG: DUF4143 domain-containing protein [Bacilli bacterium]|nr:DUF4143 domain-containing protein [Bacilli bacterium]